jgi:tricorn protease
MPSCTLLVALAFSQAPAVTDPTQAPSAAMLRYPDVGPRDIVFTFGGDLWLVDKSGGTARPLTSARGPESTPKFSNDGTRVAFVGGYEGNRDLHVLPVGGGEPQRVTHHPSTEGLCDWNGDALVFTTNALGGLTRQSRLFQVDAEGGMPRALPVPYGANGTVDRTGTWLAYTPHSIDTRTWKRYRGGMATDIWLYNLASGESRRITNHEGIDTLPMWHGGSLYYLSDEGEGHRLNIFRHDLASGATEQVTRFTDQDVRWPSIGPDDDTPGEIVFQKGDQLMLLDLGSGQARAVEVRIPGDRPRVAARRVDQSRNISAWSIGPTGNRVVVSARGDLWTLPVENGTPRPLTGTSGVFERSPSWSPDGKWIAFFDDSTGEYELYVTRADGKGERRQLTTDNGPFKNDITWSPDSKRIAWSDKTGTLRLVTLEDGGIVPVDRDPLARGMQPSFSHDGAWIAYAKADAVRQMPAIWLYEVASGNRTQVTSGTFSDTVPTFDRKGEYLAFASERRFEPTYGDVDRTWVYRDSDLLFLVPLRADVKAPWLPTSDEEKVKEDKKDESSKKDEKNEPEKPDENGKGDAPAPAAEPAPDSDQPARPADPPADAPAAEPVPPAATPPAEDEKKDPPKKDPDPIRIDLEGFEARAVQLPARGAGYGSIAFNDKGQLLYARRGDGIKLLDLTDKDRKEKNVTEGAGFEISADGKKLLVPRGGGAVVVDAAADGKARTVITSPMEAPLDPRAEWRQIILDCHRIMRDWFYDPQMHQVDWDGERDRALKLLESANSREDVNWIIAEMISELNVGHAYLQGPGDVERASNGSAGMLGVEWELFQDPGGTRAYRIARLIEGAPWDTDARNPLRAAGVKPGEFLLAVNGRAVDTSRDPWSAFDGMADKVVTITVSEKPVLDGTERDVVVRTLGNEQDLRYRAWIEGNRALVDRLSDGQVGYVYVPNTGVDGQSDLVRQFVSQRFKPALLVDDRWNGGGQIPHRFIELMNRPATNAWARRDSVDWVTPSDTHHGPKAMLINGLAGSGGDMFPWLFRHEALGKLVGTRTWGGLVGISGNPAFIDGGTISVPTFGFYKLDGTWGVEGHGVDPDVEVIDDPAVMKGGLDAGGRDPQIERAVEMLLQELKEKPFRAPVRPPPPDRSGMGVPEKDR